MSNGNWGAWQEMVLREIGRQNSHLERLESETTDILVELGKLRLIAGLCGAAAAIAVSIAIKVIV